MTIDELYSIIEERKKQLPQGSYVTSLLTGEQDRIIQKVGEEATEVVIAAKNNDRDRTISEISDLLFHVLVLMSAQDITPEDIRNELKKRHKK